jgi:hypothetical protein
MANQETELLDDIIVKSRRKMLALGGTALAGLVAGAVAPRAEAQTATYTDNDILNFALNLEYLEANFYYLSAFGCTIDKPNAAAIAAGAPSAGIPITISGGVGTAGTVTGGAKVPFATVQVGSYAVETAIEEGKHVLALQKALGTLAVNQPAINLDIAAGGAWPTLATAAGVAGGASFSPYASDAAFLVGAYVFEDVGVTAYHGAASLITGTTTILPVAAGILAVEAYHAGLVRTTITYLDPANTAGFLTITQQISTLRAALAAKVAPTAANPYDISELHRLFGRWSERLGNSPHRCRFHQRHCFLPQYIAGTEHRHRRRCRHDGGAGEPSEGSVLPSWTQRTLQVVLHH